MAISFRLRVSHPSLIRLAASRKVNFMNTTMVDNRAAVDKSGDKVRRMFGEIAPYYDRMNHVLSLNIDRYWRWKTVKRLAPIAGEPILDMCTGTGDLAIAFLKATGGKSEIIASDFCREMLDIGEIKKKKLTSGEQITFIEADAQNLPFETDRFSIVSVAFGLRNVASTEKGLSEMVRVARPGGQVAVLEFSKPEWQPFKAIYGWYFHSVLPRIGQSFAKNDSSAYSYLPASVSQFPSGEELAVKMRDAGLKDVKYYPMTFGIATLYVGVK